MYLPSLCFVMRFDKGDNWGLGFEHAAGVGKDAVLAGPSYVDGDQVHRFGELYVHGIGSFHDYDAGIFTESIFQGAVASIHRVNFRSPSAEQAIDEAADVAAQVGANPSRRLNAELIQCGGEFQAASAGEWLFSGVGQFLAPGASFSFDD